MANGATVSHIYGLPGTYTVRLEQSDAAMNPFAQAQEIRVDPLPPRVDALDAGSVGPTTVELRGSVSPGGLIAGYFFEYGRTAAYGRRTATQFTTAPTGRFDVSRVVTGLFPGTGYHYRLVAVAGGQTVSGPDRVVTTAPPPATFAAPDGGSRVPVAASGRARIVARCVAACRGSVRFFVVIHPRHRKDSKAVEMRRGRRVRIGSRSSSRSSGGTTTLTVQLTATGRALLAAQGSIRASVVANVRSRGRTVRTTTTVTLVASKKKIIRNAEVERR